MRMNTPVTDNEVFFSNTQKIVSTTNDKGVITHANNGFIEISGFDEQELIGEAHNIVRHPDMPQAAFKDLWAHNKAGKPWMGIVKNRCKNGDFYWVDAFVSSMYDNEGKAGFQSVRLPPKQTVKRRAERLYQLLRREKYLSAKLRQFTLSTQQTFFVIGFSSLILGNLALFFTDANLIPNIWPLNLTAIIAIIASSSFLAKPWKQAADETRNIINDPTARYVYSGRNDELGQLQLTIKFQQSQQSTMTWRAAGAAESLAKSSELTTASTEQNEKNMQRLQQEVDMVVTAMTEMSATVQEVANNASQTSTATQQAYEHVVDGKKVMDDSKHSVEQLSQAIDHSSHIIEELARDSENIGAVIEVINGIADQTNLLALNAAIEAARAGELGRGFAVVAEEVRSLALKTQSSTSEISDMILRLQNTASQATKSMQASKTAADNSVQQVLTANQSLDNINSQMTLINDMSIQIATAAEEQSQVVQEINQNIININNSSLATLEGCQQVNQSNRALNQSIVQLNHMIVQFSDQTS